MTDRKLVVIGRGNAALGEALFLRSYTPDITIVTLGEPLELTDENRHRMEEAAIRVIETPLKELGIEADRIARVEFVDGSSLTFDAIYSALGIHIVTGLNQLAVAMAQGEIAAVDIHNRLRAREGLRLAGAS
jgi:thioredoxin reductase (NADPH)